MRILLLILLLGTTIVGCKEKKIENEDVHSGHHKIEDTREPKKEVLSPHTSAMDMIGDAHIHIDYSSPGVRDRIIFGGLLAYDQVWQSGAHMATWVESNKDLVIAGQELPAGKYGFFTIPSKEYWTIIFNSNWEQHGKDDYSKKEDVIRFKVTPSISEEIQEHLEFKVNKIDETQGTISLAWEKVKIEFTFKVK